MYLSETLLSLSGSIIVGICYAKANKNTKWFSKHGIVTVMGLIMMAIGLGAILTT